MSVPHIGKTITYDDETGILTEEIEGGYHVDKGHNTLKNEELDEMINWCRKKIAIGTKRFGSTAKWCEGYKEAMLCVMSYLHSKKVDDK